MAKSKSRLNIIHKSPLISWIVDEQPCPSAELAEAAGINPTTWSRVINGHADMSSDTLWKVMKAIANIYPAGSIAKVVRIVEARAEGVRPPNLGEQLALLIESADEDELEQAFLSIGKKIFKKPGEEISSRDLESSYR